MAARLSALRAGRTLPSGFFIFKDSWYSFLLEAIMRPEVLGQFKKSTSSGLEPATFRLRAWYRNHYATSCPPPPISSYPEPIKSSSYLHIPALPGHSFSSDFPTKPSVAFLFHVRYILPPQHSPVIQHCLYLTNTEAPYWVVIFRSCRTSSLKTR
jgi:hypothetical protein